MLKTAFLSSTGADLRAYREAAFLAIQKLDGWKCIRMEDFGARDRDVDSFCRARAIQLPIGTVRTSSRADRVIQPRSVCIRKGQRRSESKILQVTAGSG